MKSRTSILVCLIAVLSGCDQPAESAPGAAAGGALAYELELERKPESLTQHFKIIRAGYDDCVEAARVMKLPVKPFVTVPADYAMEHVIYASDGKSYVMRQKQHTIDITEMKPQQGCATRMSVAEVIERTSNGKVEHVDIDTDGQRHVAEPMQSDAVPSFQDVKGYPAARNEKGVPLLCVGKDDPMIAAGVTASCIVNAGAGRTLRSADGRPIMAYIAERMSQDVHASPTVLQPVRARIGSVDANLLKGELK